MSNKRPRTRTYALLTLTAGATLWAGNTSAFHDQLTPTTLLAHRGVHQTFPAARLEATTCTAKRINRPTHAHVENTPSSTRAAINAGADWVEIDVRRTRDGHFIVFHDDTLDCRTNGKGLVRDHNLRTIRRLDLGYGYTHDDGASYPLRGKIKDRVTTLRDYLREFPNTKFLLDLKALSADEARSIAPMVISRRAPLMATGATGAVVALADAAPNVRPVSKPAVKRCGVLYFALGWTGYVPRSCRGKVMVLPSNYATWAWGWPHRLGARLKETDTRLIILGPRLDGDKFSRGVDSHGELDALRGAPGLIWTNRIEQLGPSRN